METVCKRLRIDRKEVYFLKYVLEACDGIAVLSTEDTAAGIVSLAIAPGCVDEVEIILNNLRETLMIEEL